jgi:hypothetical protein
MRLTGRRKPSPGKPLASSHPLARGLAGAWTFDSTLVRDRVGSLHFDSRPMLTSTAGGVEWKSGNATNTDILNPGIATHSSGAFTVAVGLTVKEAPGFGDPYVLFGGTTPGEVNGFLWNTAFDFGLSNGRLNIPSWQVRRPITLAVTCANYASDTFVNASIYVDGRWLGDVSPFTSIAKESARFRWYGQSSGNVLYSWLYRWNRALSASEIALLDADPYAIFASPRRPVFFGPAGGSIISGAGSSAGVATASGVGRSLAVSAGSTAGVGAASGTGRSLAIASASSAGVATASGTGRSLAIAAGSSSGIATASGTGRSLAIAAGSSAGVATASGVGQSASAGSGAGSSAGVGAASGVGRSLALSAGSSPGVATASGAGRSLAIAAGSSSGTATASGVGQSVASGTAVGSSAGIATASGVGRSLAIAAGSSAGTATVVGVSPSGPSGPARYYYRFVLSRRSA